MQSTNEMTPRQKYERVYALLEKHTDGLTGSEIAQILGENTHNVNRWLNAMSTEGFLTFFEGDKNFAFGRADPEIGRGKPTKRAKRDGNGEVVRYGKFI